MELLEIKIYACSTEEETGTGITTTERGTTIATEKGRDGTGGREIGTEKEKDRRMIRLAAPMTKTPIRTATGIARGFTCREIIPGRTRQFYREQCFTGIYKNVPPHVGGFSTKVR